MPAVAKLPLWLRRSQLRSRVVSLGEEDEAPIPRLVGSTSIAKLCCRSSPCTGSMDLVPCRLPCSLPDQCLYSVVHGIAGSPVVQICPMVA
ncbi:hypothetical protein SORBI_3001G289000 [Sorghum bicolor]|uniref:Uncharacterized protein n=1 Tax=Sorghum bicolor TaxID=4558 RepID=A0A1B6QLR1_SORBI|nr:hypothetical protein SORBI_3001G289000 [Sorghum bicolor]